MQVEIAINDHLFSTEMTPEQWQKVVELLAPVTRWSGSRQRGEIQQVVLRNSLLANRSDASVKASAVVPTQQRSRSDATSERRDCRKLLEEIGLIDTLLSEASASEQDVLRERREQCFAELDKLNREACGAQTTDVTTMLVPWRLLRRCEYLVELLLDKRKTILSDVLPVSSETLVEMRDELRKVQGKSVADAVFEQTVMQGSGTKSDVNLDGLIVSTGVAENVAKAFDVDKLREQVAEPLSTTFGSLAGGQVREQPIDTRYKAPTRTLCAECITPVDCDVCSFNNGKEAGGM